MKLYENVVIGNFLYSLGFCICARTNSKIPPSVVNLLQQTPSDKALGDLLLEFPGVTRLIEFKQKGNKSDKEKMKYGELVKDLEEQKATSMDTVRLSRSIHWFIEASSKAGNLVSRVVPYLDAFQPVDTVCSMAEFVERTADEAIKAGGEYTREEIRAYLKRVAKVNKKDDYAGTGAILFKVDRDGSIKYCEIVDMLMLRLTHKRCVELTERHYEKRLELQRSVDKSMSLDQGIGLG